MQFDPASLKSSEWYRLMIGVIIPRPIAWVTSVNGAGLVNVAPFSFFNGVSANPPVISLSFGYRRGIKKDTLRNIEAGKEFVVNIVPSTMADAMNQSSGDYPAEISEVTAIGLDTAPSVKVRPPRLAASPVAMECRLFQSIPVGEAPDGATLVLGEVVWLHAMDRVVPDGRVDARQLDALGRLGGTWYCKTQDQFSMERPKV